MKKIKIIGKAGQGVIWLAKAICKEMLERETKKFVSLLADYEAGVRTGTSQAQVVIDTKEIKSPFVNGADIVVDLKKSQVKYGEKIVKLEGVKRLNELALKEVLKHV